MWFCFGHHLLWKSRLYHLPPSPSLASFILFYLSSSQQGVTRAVILHYYELVNIIHGWVYSLVPRGREWLFLDSFFFTLAHRIPWYSMLHCTEGHSSHSVSHANFLTQNQQSSFCFGNILLPVPRGACCFRLCDCLPSEPCLLAVSRTLLMIPLGNTISRGFLRSC